VVLAAWPRRIGISSWTRWLVALYTLSRLLTNGPQMWMRTDFREERKWKIVLAYDLSTAVLEWHKAGSREARRELGIIVDWSKPAPREEIVDGDGDEVMDVDDNQGRVVLADPDYASDDSDDEQENDRQEVIDALAPSALLDDALNPPPEDSQDRPASPAPMELKLEDVEDALALRDGDEVSTPMDLDSQQPSTSGEASRRDSPHLPSALKATSDNPMLAEGTENNDAVQPLRPATAKSRPNHYATYRSEIAYSDELFLNLDSLAQALEVPEQSASDAPNPSNNTLPSDLSDIFPDLQPYSFFDIPTTPAPVPEGRKKSEKRDRDDPSKRVEPTTYTKLTPMAAYQKQRPTLLGPLKPSIHWVDGEWVNLDDTPVSIDMDATARPVDPSNFGKPFHSWLFEHTRNVFRSVRWTSTDCGRRLHLTHGAERYQ